MDEKRNRIEQLVELLNAASEAYYGGQEEVISNYEWDAYFDELTRLEEETGYVLLNSPTQAVGYAQNGDNEEGQKEPHEFPALSLAKTKKIEDLQKWAEDKPIWLSWKLDGLTLVATYDNGNLTKLLTRGNGTIGTNITYMSEAIQGLPQSIFYFGHLVVRGEATISYTDFNRINDELGEDEDKYANPRNLASGTLALDAKHIDKVRERGLTFNAFTLVYMEDNILSWGERMDTLESLGFTVVDREATDAQRLPETVEKWTKRVETGDMKIPVDGLVIAYDDTDYASTGSVTGHHATRAGYAFKWQDESAFSILNHVEWSCAASVITPVAVFEPVQLEGTTVSRASLCNISEMERLGIGENGKTELEIIKANKIIPKCISVKSKAGSFTVPEKCPVCGANTRIFQSESGIKTLRCTDAKCPAKNLKKFERLVSKAGLDVDGLSRETLRDFVNEKFVATYGDIFRIAKYAENIKGMEGYGEKSCQNILAAVEKSRDADPINLLVAVCIPLIGVDAAKRIIRTLGWQGFLQRLANNQSFEDIDGLGSERSNSILEWHQDADNQAQWKDLLQELRVKNTEPSADAEGKCKGLTFVITGDVHIFANRDAFKAYVEAQGGKVAGSVSGKTAYLVTNDTTSGSNKNEKAKELQIPIISEDQFMEMFR